MREILFRGKNKFGAWYYGYYTEGYYLDGTPVAWIEVVDRKEKDTESVTVIPETVGQYTGLTDKSGKKIFEGDIVRDGYLFGKVVFATAQDGFDGMAGFMVDDISDGLQNYNGFWHEVEILGNIHDNPELLEGGAVDG